ncbi:MAG: hypothetical protein JST50_22630 [Bacteroidetes bacterium]|nr:hypothetical protein [Bacteroidota bacterium]
MRTTITACYIIAIIFLASCQKSAVSPASEKSTPAFTSKSLASVNSAMSYNDKQDFDMTTLGIQATSCTGEQLQVVSGIYHLDLHGVINGNTFTAVEHVNAQNFKLVGEATGTTYAGSVSYNQSFNTTFTNGKFVTKTTQSILLTTPGGKNNVMVKMDVHLTINAQGVVTASIDNFRTDDCK